VQSTSEASEHIRQHFSVDDFKQGKQHLVQKLRLRVALSLESLTPEELLEILVGSVQSWRGNSWQEEWNPVEILISCGLSTLLYADTVEAVGPNEDGQPGDIVVSFRRQGQLELIAISNGMECLHKLKITLQDVYKTCGNLHWGDAVDIRALADSLDVGFVVFVSEEQGINQWIQYVNYRRADYPFWMFLYWEEPSHYRLVQVRTSGADLGISFCALSQMPAFIRQHFNLCHESTPMHEGAGGGVV
jgi:hypothetical protein